MHGAPTETLIFDAVWAISALIGVPLLHFIFMRVDLSLRNPDQMNQGGIPDTVITIFQFGSLLLFGGLVFLSLALLDSLLIRLLIATLATMIAFIVMIFCWLRYITGNCIDTL
ncbi:MAG: hypothetical protein AAF236_07525 [Verrucomicrobiota bacterium]